MALRPSPEAQSDPGSDSTITGAAADTPPATAKQIALLRQLRCPIPAGLTVDTAHELIVKTKAARDRKRRSAMTAVEPAAQPTLPIGPSIPSSATGSFIAECLYTQVGNPRLKGHYLAMAAIATAYKGGEIAVFRGTREALAGVLEHTRVATLDTLNRALQRAGLLISRFTGRGMEWHVLTGREAIHIALGDRKAITQENVMGDRQAITQPRVRTYNTYPGANAPGGTGGGGYVRLKIRTLI